MITWMRLRSLGVALGKGKKLCFPPIAEDSPPGSGFHVEACSTCCFHMASQTDPMGLVDSPTPGLADVIAAIATCQATLTAKIKAVQLDVSLLRQDMDKLHSRVTETEQRVIQTEDEVEEHNTTIRSLQIKVKALEYRVEDAENRNRRNNLRIIGLAEGMEGANPSSFVEDLLRNLLPDAHFSPHYAVERAHRVLPKPRPPGAHPSEDPNPPTA